MTGLRSTPWPSIRRTYLTQHPLHLREREKTKDIIIMRENVLSLLSPVRETSVSEILKFSLFLASSWALTSEALLRGSSVAACCFKARHLKPKLKI